MDGLHKIGFVSIILLIGLFSLQMSLKKQDYLNGKPATGDKLFQAEAVDHNDDGLEDYQGPLIFPVDTIRKYYLDPKSRNLFL